MEHNDVTMAQTKQERLTSRDVFFVCFVGECMTTFIQCGFTHCFNDHKKIKMNVRKIHQPQ